MSGAGSSQAFLNPHGVLHELVTVTWAENVVLSGAPTTEFTWYPGYAWRIAWCGRCGAHVGWSFDAIGDGAPRTFWGLRRQAIVEEQP
jgi:cereblon